jgi:DNA invertase Pin-like site-specific DNA recombinase
MVQGFFNRTTKDNIHQARLKGLDKRRSPELKKAWAEQGKIQEAYVRGVRVMDIAHEYGVDNWSIYRILKVKNP